MSSPEEGQQQPEAHKPNADVERARHGMAEVALSGEQGEIQQAVPMTPDDFRRIQEARAAAPKPFSMDGSQERSRIETDGRWADASLAVLQDAISNPDSAVDYRSTASRVLTQGSNAYITEMKDRTIPPIGVLEPGASPEEFGRELGALRLAIRNQAGTQTDYKRGEKAITWNAITDLTLGNMGAAGPAMVSSENKARLERLAGLE